MDSIERRARLALKSEEAYRERFWRRVTFGDGCWVFDAVAASGYGSYGKSGFQMPAHRYAKIITHGLPPSFDMHACHMCHNRACVRPTHIYWGTAKENAADTAKDGTLLRPLGRGERNKCAKLSNKQAERIFVLFHRDGVTARSLAKQYKVTPTVCQNIVSRATYIEATEKAFHSYFKSENLGFKVGHKNANAKLSAEEAKKIFQELLHPSINQDALAFQYGVSKILITRMKTGLAWRHLAPKKLLAGIPPTRRRIQVDAATRVIIKQKMLAGAKMREIAAEYGISMATASNIRRDPD